MLGHLVRQRGGHDGLAHDGVFGHGPLLNAARADVIQQQNADFVAGKQLIAAILALNGNANAVSIGVSGQHQVCTRLFGQFQAKAQSLENFGVGIGAGGEIAVRLFLFRHNGDIGNADVMQNMGDRNQAGAVQRAVNQLQAGGLADTGTDGAGFDCFVQGVDAVIANVFDDALFQPLGKRHGFCAGQDVGLLDFGVHDVSGLIGHLAAIGAVGLIAVVLGRVVGCRYHDTGVAVIIPGSKAQCGNRHQGAVNAHLYAVGGQNFGSSLGKHIALDAAVIADSNGLGAALGLDPVGKALGSLAHNIHVHAVGTGADHTAQTGSAELKSNGKTILYGSVIVLNRFQLRLQVGVIQVGSKPTAVHFFIHFGHHHFLTL